MKNFKIFLVVFIALWTVVPVAAQEGQIDEVDALVQSMFILTEAKEYDALLDITYPKVFEMLPKENMKEIMVGMLEGNEDFKIEIAKGIPAYVLSPVFTNEENNTDFAFVSYPFNMKMTFLNQVFDEESKVAMASMMKVQGMEVSFISDTEVTLSQAISVTILIKDEATNGEWSLINYDADSPMFYQILPAEVIEKAKEFKQDRMLKLAQKK